MTWISGPCDDEPVTPIPLVPRWMTRALADAMRVGRKVAITPIYATQDWRDGSPDDVEHIERTIDELTRAGVALPPERSRDEARLTDSVPAMEAAIAAWHRSGFELIIKLAQRYPLRSPERYTIELLGPRGGLVNHLDTCRWRIEVESRRWVAQDATGGYDDTTWWVIWQGVMRLRWTLNERRGPLPGYLPSQEVATPAPAPVLRIVTFGEAGWRGRAVAWAAFLHGWDVEFVDMSGPIEPRPFEPGEPS